MIGRASLRDVALPGCRGGAPALARDLPLAERLNAAVSLPVVPRQADPTRGELHVQAPALARDLPSKRYLPGAPELDNHANNFSPAPPPVGAGTPPSPTRSSNSAAAPNPRRRRHSLRRASGRLLPCERVASCGQKSTGQHVTLHVHDGHAHFGAIETCGSVWTCPVCAAKVTEGRKADIEAILAAHAAEGGVAFMATLTVPHTAFSRCRALRKGVSTAWSKVKSGKAWVTARECYGWQGDIRALEVTHGRNGWHPHLHVLILFRPGTSKRDTYGFGGWLFDAWARAVERLGMGACHRDAFSWELADVEGGAGQYVGKWGAALELTKAHIKAARAGGRTPWQILSDYAAGRSAEDARLFREYAAAFKGARQLTWSRGLRDRYQIDEPAADIELAAAPQLPETQVATMDGALFRAVVKAGKTAELLDVLESSGIEGVHRLLATLRIPCRRSWRPGLEPGRWVPLLSLRPSPGETSPASPSPENWRFPRGEAFSNPDENR